MKTKRFIIACLILIALSVYFFVSAPPPLPSNANAADYLDIQKAFEILDGENKAARKLYTDEIVKYGLKQGLRFDENWQEDDIQAGPLPAQFLRLIARNLEANKLPLGLFLGSDFPINSANKFSQQQLSYFNQIKVTHLPQFFYMADIGRYIYMSADIAISTVCINCHNKHKDSPKTDWKLDDVMGATTWTYPKQRISYAELLALVNAFRSSTEQAYAIVIDKFESIHRVPVINQKWPKEGYYLPNRAEFMHKLGKQTALITITVLLATNSADNLE